MTDSDVFVLCYQDKTVFRMGLFLLFVLVLSSWVPFSFAASSSDCRQVLDIGFIIDTSASESTEGLVRSQAFAIDVVQNFTIGINSTRVAAIHFSHEATADFLFDDYRTTDEVTLAITKIPLDNSDTRIDKALMMGMEVMFTDKGGSRPNAKKILIIETDGNFLDEGLPLFRTLLTPYQEKGIDILVAGMGSSEDEQIERDLKALSLLKPANVFNDTGLWSLVSRIRSLADDFCKGTPAS